MEARMCFEFYHELADISKFYLSVDLMDLLFNQEKKFYNSTLADLETSSYYLPTSIYYKNSLNLTMSLVTNYYP
jgi:hypothetical protein